MVKFVSLKFFGPSTTKWRSYKVFAKLNGNHLLMTNIFKLHKCQTFGLLKMLNMSKICEKACFTIIGLSKMLSFNFCFFLFSKFQMDIVKNVMELPSSFKMDFEDSYEVLLRHKYFWSTYFWQWNDGPFKIFWNFHGNAFCFFIFSKWKKYHNFTFDDKFQNVLLRIMLFYIQAP